MSAVQANYSSCASSAVLLHIPKTCGAVTLHLVQMYVVSTDQSVRNFLESSGLQFLVTFEEPSWMCPRIFPSTCRIEDCTKEKHVETAHAFAKLSKYLEASFISSPVTTALETPMGGKTAECTSWYGWKCLPFWRHSWTFGLDSYGKQKIQITGVPCLSCICQFTRLKLMQVTHPWLLWFHGQNNDNKCWIPKCRTASH